VCTNLQRQEMRKIGIGKCLCLGLPENLRKNLGIGSLFEM
jgi:hypothetical protein